MVVGSSDKEKRILVGPENMGLDLGRVWGLAYQINFEFVVVNCSGCGGGIRGGPPLPLPLCRCHFPVLLPPALPVLLHISLSFGFGWVWVAEFWRFSDESWVACGRDVGGLGLEFLSLVLDGVWWW